MKSALRVIGSVLGITILGIIATILVVWVYSTFVAPGKQVSEYQAFANVAGPWVSVIIGPLATFFVVRMATRKSTSETAKQQAFWIMGLYLALDVTVLIASAPKPAVWVFAIISGLGRCAAAWLAVSQKRSLAS